MNKLAMIAACVLSACSLDTADGTVEEGNAALLAGKVDEAVQLYQEAAASLPESPPLNFDRGLAASLSGAHEEAVGLLLRALDSKDKALLQKVQAALGTAYARDALALERVPPPAPDPAAPAEAEPGPPKIPEPAMDKWKLAVGFLQDALLLDPNDAESRRTLEVALLRVDPPCATRDDKYEDNDNRDAAKPIEVKVEEPNQSQDPNNAPEPNKDVLRAREQVFSCPDDDDWYALDLAAGDRVELAPTVPKDAGRLAFEVLRPDGTKAWQWTSAAQVKLAPGLERPVEPAPRFVFTVAPNEAGKWLVQQTNVDSDEVSYGLEVVVRPACEKNEDRYEDNDLAATAKQLTPGPVPDLKRCPGDEDWYGVTLAEGESLFMYAQPEGQDDSAEKPKEGEPPKPPPFRIEIVDETGAVRSRGAPIDKSQVSTLLMPGAGKYLVRVFDADPGVSAPYEGRYSLQVEVVPPCPEGDDRFEDNDDALSATDFMAASAPPDAGNGMPQQPQGPPVIFARVCPNDVDWWKITTDGTKPQIASLVFDHAQGDLSLELLDEAGAASVMTSDTSSAAQNGEAVALPMAEKPAPDPNAPPAPAPDPNAPPDPSAPKPEPKTYTLKVAAKADGQNFYLLRLDQPSGGGGDSNDQKDDSEDSKDDKDPQDSKDQADKADPKDQQDKGEQKDQQNPLQDALDNLDRNPENLPARDAARKSPLANQKPLKDW